MMNLKILSPSQTVIEVEVSKVTAEAVNGFFCLLPKHIDFTAALAPGLLSFEDSEGKETFAAVDEGILVKCGAEVLVSTRSAVVGAALGELEETIEKEFKSLDEMEKKSRSALAKIEADFARRFLETGEYGETRRFI